jgi:hypothetical protein
MRSIVLAGASALAFAAACSACGGEESAVPRDAGSAGSGSGGTLGGGGGTGGGAVGGADSGTGGDAAIDVAPDAFGDDWELAPWNPPECQILRAKDLAKAVPPLVWKDCENGIAGCVYLDTSGIPGTPYANGDKLNADYQVARMGTSTYFSITPIFGKYDNGVVLYELGVGPRAAWKSDQNATHCSVSYLRFGTTGGAALSFGESGGNEVVNDIVYSKDDVLGIDSASLLKVDKTVTGNSLAGVFDLHFSSSLMAFEMGLDRLIYTWDFGPGKPQLIPRPSDIAEDYAAIVKGSETVFVRDSSMPTARAFAVRHADGTVENLYQKPSVWAIGLLGDDTDFVWQEQDPTSGAVELWTAPWTTSSASFAPKKVRAIDGLGGYLAAAGYSGDKWWIYYKDDTTLRAVRITDGAWLDAPAPKGFGWLLRPFGVVNGEIWASIHLPPSTQTRYSVARVPIASLGTPQQ